MAKKKEVEPEVETKTFSFSKDDVTFELTSEGLIVKKDNLQLTSAQIRSLAKDAFADFADKGLTDKTFGKEVSSFYI